MHVYWQKTFHSFLQTTSVEASHCDGSCKNVSADCSCNTLLLTAHIWAVLINICVVFVFILTAHVILV